MKNISIVFYLLCSILLLSGCNDDNDSDFKGDDNYITSFKLTLNGSDGENSIVTAYIDGENITITIPESLSLVGAHANVITSENTKIYPNPADIENWDAEHSFVVSSYTGKQNIYHYTIRREKPEAEKDGSFMLFSQTDVDNFASLGIKRLNGNITIGKNYSSDPNGVSDANDPITSLGGLATLEEVKGTITIYACPNDYSVGFQNLKKVGSIRVPEDRNRMKDFIFPALEEAYGDISNPEYNGSAITLIYMPKLSLVGGDFKFGGLRSLTSLSVPELKRVMGNLSLRGNGVMGTIETLPFPKLEQIGDQMDIYAFPGTSIQTPALKICGGFAWQSCNNVTTVEAPALEQLFGSSSFQSCGKITKISFSKVTYIESIELSGLSSLENVEIPQLKSARNITFSSLSKLTNLRCLSTLESVKETLSLQNLNGLTEKFALPTTLTNIGELVVANLPGLTELDIRGTGIKGVGITSSSPTPFKLTADDVLEGSLTLSGLFELSGMKEVKGNVSISVNNTNNAVTLIPNMETVNGNFTLTYNYTTGSLDLPSLTTVKGACKIKTKAAVTVPKLKEVGLSFTYDKGGAADNGTIPDFTLPKLASVGGDFIIYTGHTMAGLNYPQDQGVPFDIKMPALTTIAGILKIHTHEVAATSTRPSNRLANLNGFSNLSKVNGVDIYRQAALRNYEGLKNAITSFSAGYWTLLNVGYKPTYEDLATDNKYIDPSLPQ